MRCETILMMATGLLLSIGCTGTQVARHISTREDDTVGRRATGDSTNRESFDLVVELTAEPAVVQQTSLFQPQPPADVTPPAASASPADSALPMLTPTLESFEQLALTSNPTLIEFESRVDAANGRWFQVGLKPNPVAGISAQEIGNDGSAGQFGTFVQQQFVTADKLELNRRAASWNVKSAEHQLAAQQLRVLTDVRRAFYSVRVAQERVKVAEELQSIAKLGVEKAKELVKVQEPRTVLTQAEIEFELAGVFVANSMTQLVAQWQVLAAVIGQPDLPLQEVVGDLSSTAPQIMWDETLARIRQESPEVAAAIARVEQSRWALQRAAVQATPNVTVQAGVFYDDSSGDPFGTLQVSMPIPVNNRNQGNIAAAHANVAVAVRRVQRVELSLQQRLAVVFQQFEQSRQQAARYGDTILKKAKENLDLNQQGYEAGNSSYLAVLTAQRSYSRARLAWLNALEQLWSATVQIDGLLLADSLE